jgi:hypothetical protein
MDLRRSCLYITRTRVGLGLAILASPRLALGSTYGAAAGVPEAAAIGRMLGAREVALGGGAAIATGEQRGSANWVSMIAVADGIDAVVNLSMRRLGWRARLLGVVAAASAVGHLLLARQLARDLDA